MTLIFGSATYLCYACSLFFDEVIKKKVSARIRVETADELKFPTVTICNNNLWTLTALLDTSYHLETYGLFEVFKDLYDTAQSLPPPIDKYNWSDPTWAPIADLKPNDTEWFLGVAAHPMKDSIYHCTMFGILTNCSDVFDIVATDRGYCFQFNGDGKKNATSAGKTGGISMVLNANVDLYTTGPASFSEGFSLTFHNAHEVPMVSELSIGLSPGTEANVQLHKSAHDRVPPYADGGRADCFDTLSKPNPLHFYKNYSYSGCQVECKVSYVIQKCGCRDPLMPALNGSTACDFPTMLYCSAPAMRNFTSDVAGLKSCNCRDPCKNSEYTAKVSSTRFPSTNYALLMDMDIETVEHVQRNWIMVNIFYGKMSFQQLEEEITYDVFDMIANVGGTLGVCLGASALTICEFLEFGILAVFKWLKSRKQVKPSITVVKVKGIKGVEPH
ncbi:acid-sensing ion channel 4-B-like [Watersipora subatra]|uniref:acid-sensing ion channel 4-B-like n=1 Tax=Watersipora subatra TaxID=2589382 RepID=UPI00355AEB57